MEVRVRRAAPRITWEEPRARDGRVPGPFEDVACGTERKGVPREPNGSRGTRP